MTIRLFFLDLSLAWQIFIGPLGRSCESTIGIHITKIEATTTMGIDFWTTKIATISRLSEYVKWKVVKDLEELNLKWNV